MSRGASSGARQLAGICSEKAGDAGYPGSATRLPPTCWPTAKPPRSGRCRPRGGTPRRRDVGTGRRGDDRDRRAMALGRDPAGNAAPADRDQPVPGPRPAVHPCHAHGRKPRLCGQRHGVATWAQGEGCGSRATAARSKPAGRARLSPRPFRCVRKPARREWAETAMGVEPCQTSPRYQQETS
jgi:hypothetical protein